MEIPKRLSYAYKQTPWRTQLRAGAWVLLGLVVFALIAVTNLRISAKTYATGIEIQMLESEKEDISHQIADLRNQLGTITSYSQMAERAAENGYAPISGSGQVIYLTVPGYQPPAVVIDSAQFLEAPANPILKPAYTQSLWDVVFGSGLKLDKYSQRFSR